MKYVIGLTALLLLAGCNGNEADVFTPAANTATNVKTAQGDLTGFIAQNGSYTWRGVPYGADTSGDNRWRAPRPAPAWDGTREAVNFAPVCPQIATAFTPIESFTNGKLEGSEDCLAFDIYAPANSKGKALPVMVWIHGGSNVSGASQLYIGENLAKNENVIVMSVQYRLGPLGWFSHPALVESAVIPEDASANFGTLDLIASLKWVQENAASFGGDPDNVTIFGESAGGHNVTTLLASPLTKDLFHRAIIQSGSFDSISIDEARGISGEHLNPSLDVAARLGGPDAFHTASLQEIFEGFELDAGGFTEVPRIIEDGIAIPATPLREAFASVNTFNVVPTISGINKDEMKLFYLFDDKLTKTKFGQFIVARDQNFYDAAAEYSSRIWRIRSVDRPLAMMTAAGHFETYAYQFDWDEGGKFLWMDTAKMLGAAHAMEIPFVFNRYKMFGDADKLVFQKKTLKTRETLSRSMGSYWANFARTGKPTNPNGPAWEPYGAGANVMYFDSANDEGIRPELGADSFAKLTADLKVDARLTPEQRCEIAKGLIEWNPTITAEMDVEKACTSES